MDKLRVSLVQTSLIWQDAEANRQHFSKLIQPLAHKTDLIILPEMFTTGFSMEAAKLAETVDGPSIQWMKEQAQQTQAVITASLIIKDQAHYYNRLYWVEPNGKLQYYDKRHLFSLANEHQHYTAGKARLIVEYKGWRICPLICYDLRFPVWSRNDAEIDLLIYTANWPSKRSADWCTLLQARAIENQCYVAAVNRIGLDEKGHHYRGDSSLIAPGPRRILCQLAEIEASPTLSISKTDLQQTRQKLPFLADRDLFALQ